MFLFDKSEAQNIIAKEKFIVQPVDTVSIITGKPLISKKERRALRPKLH
jgi:hypothetical protein